MTAITILLHPVVHRGSRSPMLTEEAQLYLEGSYTDQALYRVTDFLGSRTEAAMTFPLMMFLFLWGVRLYRAGAFGDDRVGRTLRSRMAVWGLGLPLNALAAAGPEALDFAGRYVFSSVLMMGYVGLVGLLLDRVRRTGPVAASLTAVGRTALSCYLLQNLLTSVLFYGWGLGLAAHADHTGWMVAAWAVISLVLVAASRWWLSRFARGPMELFQARLLALAPEVKPSSGPGSDHRSPRPPGVGAHPHQLFRGHREPGDE